MRIKKCLIFELYSLHSYGRDGFVFHPWNFAPFEFAVIHVLKFSTPVFSYVVMRRFGY